jgi:hypothetical protein
LGTKLVRRQGLVAFALFILSCKPGAAPQAPQRPAAPVPQTRATVLTIQTTIQPGNRTTSHTVVIANGRARSGDELDAWRLFDVAHDQVTFVNDLEKTYRTVAAKQLAKDRRGALKDPLPDNLPHAALARTGAKKSLQGVTATQSIVTLGGYKHELWVGEHPLIPPQLYAMMIASASPSSPLVPVMKEVDEALMNVRGFPLAEHSELAYGNKKMTVDTEVVKIEQRDVPSWFLNVRGDYKDVSVKIATPAPPSS